MAGKTTKQQGTKHNDSKKEPNIEVVGLPKELIIIMKDNKKKNGTSVRFYAEQAVRKQLIADGLLKE